MHPSGRKSFAALSPRTRNLAPEQNDGPTVTRYSVHLTAPDPLSIVKNPEKTLKFIADLERAFDLRKSVFVRLKKVKRVEYDGLTVLLSVMVRFKSHLIPFNGDFPADKEARKAVVESGFLSYLFKRIKKKASYEIGSNSIHTHAKKYVDSDLTDALVTSATKTIWGDERRCTGVQAALIELMHNTHNHAALEKKGHVHWWLSLRHVQSEKKVAFSFVDYGVGVFESLAEKQAGNKFYGSLIKLVELCTVGTNDEILKLIFAGELHRTATGKSYRGKGLPRIYDVYEKNGYSNLAVVTNDVYFNSATNQCFQLSKPFRGTLVYWELTENNLSLPNEA